MEPTGYRPNVSLIVLVGDSFLVVRKREWPGPGYKFPQGGIESGESIEEAAHRELFEELGVNGDLVGVSVIENRYDWPHPKPPYRGQDQRFVVMRIDQDATIVIDPEELTEHHLVDRDAIIGWSERSGTVFDDYNGCIPKVFEEFGL